MMILRNSPASPFGRKVLIGAGVLGLADEIRVEHADPVDENDSLRMQNPLGKLPVLIAEDGTAYYDSRVILEFLDLRAGGGRIIPRETDARFAALRMQALCDGINDASLLLVYESRWRPAERHDPKWIAHQQGKVKRGLDAIEANPPALTSPPHVGLIALACALGYRDLRFQGAWRSAYPRLMAWLAAFEAQVPAFAATRIAA
jgi:glutathione S-transferase